MGNNVFLSSSELSCNVWLDMNNNIVTNLPSPVNPGDGVNKAYVDNSISSNLTAPFIKITPIPGLTATNVQDALSELTKEIANYLPLSGGTMTGTINMNDNSITNLATPTQDQATDAANVQYVNTYIQNNLTSVVQPAINDIKQDIQTNTNSITNLTNSLKEYLPLSGGTMTGNLQMNDHTIIGLATPKSSESTNAANVNYVNTLFDSIHFSPFYSAIQANAPSITTSDSVWININDSNNTFFHSSSSNLFFSWDASYNKWFLLQKGLFFFNFSFTKTISPQLATVNIYLNDSVSNSKTLVTSFLYSPGSGGYVSSVIPIINLPQNSNQYFLTYNSDQTVNANTTINLIWLPVG